MPAVVRHGVIFHYPQVHPRIGSLAADEGSTQRGKRAFAEGVPRERRRDTRDHPGATPGGTQQRQLPRYAETLAFRSVQVPEPTKKEFAHFLQLVRLFYHCASYLLPILK